MDTYPLHDLGGSAAGNLVDLLARWCLTNAQWSNLISQGGRSGAQLFRLTRQDGIQFVLKLTCCRSDWVMAVTEDWHYREAKSAIALAQRLRNPRTAVLDSVIQGNFAWILMKDVSVELEAAFAPNAVGLETIVRGIVDLHSQSIDHLIGVPFCQPDRRLLLMSPTSADVVRSCGHTDIAELFGAGWRAFFKHAPENVSRTTLLLMNQPSMLSDLVKRFRPSIVHGDLKLDNIGLHSDGIVLIDWALVMYTAPAIDIGWFIAANSEKLSPHPEAILSMFESHKRLTASDWRDERDLSIVVGLLLRGWKKALDFDEGRSHEFCWWIQEFNSSISRILS